MTIKLLVVPIEKMMMPLEEINNLAKQGYLFVVNGDTKEIEIGYENGSNNNHRNDSYKGKEPV